MNTKFPGLGPGERVIVFQKGLTIGDFILNGVLLLIMAGGISLGAFLALISGYDPSMPYFFIGFLIIGPLLWLYLVVSFIIRAVTAKGILTDRRVVFTDRASSRAEIPLSDIESMRDTNKRQVEIERKSLYSKKYYVLKDARAFVDAYNRLMDSNPNK